MYKNEEYPAQNLQSDVDIKDFLKQLSKMLNHQKRYFFYFNNMIELCRTYDEVQGLNIRVKNEFTNYFVEVLENFANGKLLSRLRAKITLPIWLPVSC